MDNKIFFGYVIIMALTTYLIRMLPLVLVKKKIKNKFLISFLYYTPYAVLSVMTVPAIFYSTSYMLSASIGFITALVLSYFEKSLLKVAIFSCLAVFVAELVIKFI